jgi:hypothetical protein
MIVFKDYTMYHVLDKEVVLVSDDVGSGLNTVAEIDNNYYYLGNETPNILAAILAWQEFSGKDLSEDEMKQVLMVNDLYSGAV